MISLQYKIILFQTTKRSKLRPVNKVWEHVQVVTRTKEMYD